MGDRYLDSVVYAMLASAWPAATGRELDLTRGRCAVVYASSSASDDDRSR